MGALSFVLILVPQPSPGQPLTKDQHSAPVGTQRTKAWPTQVSDNIARDLNEVEEFQGYIRNILTEKFTHCKGETDHFRAEEFNIFIETKKVKFG